MEQCQGLAGRLLGHNFIKAYDSFPPDRFKGNSYFGNENRELAEVLTRRIFRGMYCTRCGAATNAKEATNA